MNLKINQIQHDVNKISVKLNVWPSFLDNELAKRGELRKMNSGPDYFVWDIKNRKSLAMFNMDSPVTFNYSYDKFRYKCLLV